MSSPIINNHIKVGYVCLIDSASTHIILKDKQYFSHLVMREANVSTISGSTNLIEGSGSANVVLHGGTKLHIDDALYSTKSRRNLLSYKDIRRNGYHIETIEEENREYIAITNMVAGNKYYLEKLPAISSGLYYTHISTIESNFTINSKFMDHDKFVIWYDRLGHPGSIMMRKILENSIGHSLLSTKIQQSKDFACVACSQGKLIIRPSPTKVRNESLTFLERIQGDICGPIHPLCGPFRYFMVLHQLNGHMSPYYPLVIWLLRDYLLN
ncbi:hypothetical protein LINGRAHAP2_LOCUS14704 [Linum grandiflorum]